MCRSARAFVDAMGKRKGEDEEDRGKKATRSKREEAYDKDDDETSENAEEFAARKGKKIALKATRRLARILRVRFNEGSGSDEENEESDGEGAFAGFPSRKQARKLSEAQREELVDRLTSMGERVVAMSSKLVHSYGGKAGKGGIAGTGMEVVTDMGSQPVSGAFQQMDMWRQLSAVSRRCCDAAVACSAAAQGKQAVQEEDPVEADGSGAKGDAQETGLHSSDSAVGGRRRTFKDWYMEKFTDAFGEDLDRIRVQELEGGKASSVTALIDAVVAGIDVIPHLERTVCLSHLE